MNKLITKLFKKNNLSAQYNHCEVYAGFLNKIAESDVEELHLTSLSIDLMETFYKFRMWLRRNKKLRYIYLDPVLLNIFKADLLINESLICIDTSQVRDLIIFYENKKELIYSNKIKLQKYVEINKKKFKAHMDSILCALIILKPLPKPIRIMIINKVIGYCINIKY